LCANAVILKFPDLVNFIVVSNITGVFACKSIFLSNDPLISSTSEGRIIFTSVPGASKMLLTLIWSTFSSLTRGILGCVNCIVMGVLVSEDAVVGHVIKKRIIIIPRMIKKFDLARYGSINLWLK